MLRRVLVANRSEVAVRVVRACHELGLQAVAIHSEADRGALHCRLADTAVAIGPAPSRQSYLDQDKVLQAALANKCDAVHPGYGFLSENAAFAQKVLDAGLVWVGPPPKAMAAMGDKVASRAHAEAAGVPVAPGSEKLHDAAHARREAQRIGYPVILKASQGGGGLGMRVVRSPDHMESQFTSAREQAAAAFGVPDLFLEKYLERPRHIEIQVLGDRHGHMIHLGERECSVQRRHQKLVEEAPSPALSPEQRAEIGQKAVELARRVGYENAGTLEFLHQDGQFHFNEMNARLQVEHPVTELVTGIDIVAWQLRIAGGERLSLRQQDVQVRGHAIECRINAEEPARGFAPSPGPVRKLRLPGGPGIRIDTALMEGWTVPSEYDSLVLKLVAHAPDRDAAVRRMQRALAELRIEGFGTNRDLQRLVMSHPAFRRGEATTRFLEEHALHEVLVRAARVRAAAVAAALETMPGGLAALQMTTRLPRPVAKGGRRDWEAA